jgi:hypothetical protein
MVLPVVQVGQDAGHQGLEDFLLPDTAQETQRDAPDVLIGVLQVVPQVLADQNLQDSKKTNNKMGHQNSRLYVNNGMLRVVTQALADKDQQQTA